MILRVRFRPIAIIIMLLTCNCNRAPTITYFDKGTKSIKNNNNRYIKKVEINKFSITNNYLCSNIYRPIENSFPDSFSFLENQDLWIHSTDCQLQNGFKYLVIVNYIGEIDSLIFELNEKNSRK